MLVERAEVDLAAADMPLHAMMARRRRGELLGDAGIAIVHEADAWCAARGIRRPDRFAAMLAPGWP